MDEKGYVYEKTAIVDYIRAQPRATASTMRPCPVAGDPFLSSTAGTAVSSSACTWLLWRLPASWEALRGRPLPVTALIFLACGAGTTHQVSERGLKPANKVLKAKRRQARGLGPRSQKPVQDSVVLDDEDAEVQGQDEDIEEVL